MLGDARYDIRAAVTPARARVLKCEEVFVVFDEHGDIVPTMQHDEGLYHRGTRHLSRFSVRVGGCRPILLSSTVIETNDLLVVDSTNPHLEGEGAPLVHGTLHLMRSRFLRPGVLYERLQFVNYGDEAVEAEVLIEFDADFADIFEVRGIKRVERGQLREPAVGDDTVTLRYEGLDSVLRQTRLHFETAPAALSRESARYRVSLGPGQRCELDMYVACAHGEPFPATSAFDEAYDESMKTHRDRRQHVVAVATSNEAFNEWWNRSLSDLLMLVSQTGEGPYPYAGVPWYSTVFGRDGLITALQWLVPYPSLARGVLTHLAARQATTTNPAADADPGKILHEARDGEMAELGEVPFGCYYGTVDATPLFVLLAGAYVRQTGDLEFLETLWPAVERAIEWIERYGDRDGDGFLEYQRQDSRGLANQGWKDSWDSIFHADGRFASGPIALCEVQAYAYAAWRAGARMARMLSHHTRAAGYEERAVILQRRFDESFWSEELGLYALALDGDKRPCLVRASNSGHCLFAGIALPERAPRIAKELCSARFFAGWGVRTLAEGEPHYNPMSYHNGSIWPHDTALTLAGLTRYGCSVEAGKLAQALFDVSTYVDLRRLPELFCGFPRRRGEGPTAYPVACSPQAWATGAAPLVLISMLGLRIDGVERRLRFYKPALPRSIRQVELRGLEVGSARVHIRARRHTDDVSIRILSADDEVEVVIVK